MIALARLGALPKGEAAEADGAGFGDAMRQIARGICLVTYGTGDEGAGVTATSVSTLSADPPTLIVCVDRSASIYQSLARAAPFGVSVLSASQREFADRFSGGADLKGERLRGARWRTLPAGIRVLWDASAAFECEVEDVVDRHAHAIVIGRVRRALSGPGSGALIYWRSACEPIGWSEEEVSRAIGSRRRMRQARSGRPASGQGVRPSVCLATPPPRRAGGSRHSPRHRPNKRSPSSTSPTQR
jgi:flavin reductase (DIM6/NTAB) family NADH-FMN oxidoreductase RutF